MWFQQCQRIPKNVADIYIEIIPMCCFLFLNIVEDFSGFMKFCIVKIS